MWARLGEPALLPGGDFCCFEVSALFNAYEEWIDIEQG